MENKTSEKSLIFVSHSSKDKQLAEILRQQLFQVLENIISEDVFVSSSPEGIDAGALWFKNVISTLKKATALIVLVTPNSLQSNWVWFEIGYFWSKKHKQIYPLYVPDVDKIPHPLNEHQAKSLVDPDEMLAFYNILCNQFKGNPKKANPNAFTEYSASITNSKLSESDVKALLRDYFTSAYKS